MAIVDFTNDLLPFMELNDEDSYANVSRIHDSVERFVKSYCGREFESAVTKEEFTHNDTTSLFLTETPITKITKIALGSDDALRIYNSNSATTAIVNVSTTELVLTYNGTDDSADLTFATNTTISALVTSINAVGSGWVAESVTGFASHLSTELLPRYGAEAIDNTNVYLRVPRQALSDFEVDPDTGEVMRSGGFMASSRGTRGPSYIPGDVYLSNDTATTGSTKIYVHYTGGYTSTTMPEDIKLCVMLIVKTIYQRVEEESFSLSGYSIGDISKKIDMLPKEAVHILNSYARWRI